MIIKFKQTNGSMIGINSDQITSIEERSLSSVKITTATREVFYIDELFETTIDWLNGKVPMRNRKPAPKLVAKRAKQKRRT